VSACPACGGEGARVFFQQDDVPAVCHLRCRTREEALAVPRGRLRLAACPTCGLVWNRAFDPSLAPYDARYDNALHASPRFRAYARGLIDALGAARSLDRARVLEVGCGDGWFLAELCRAHGCEAIGLDPGCDPAAAPRPERGSLRLVRSGLADAPAAELGAPPDLVVCRHVLEHLADPVAALRRMRGWLAPGGRVYLEVPEGSRTFLGAGVWDLLHEHVLYFAAPALRALLCRSGLRAHAVHAAYGGQFLGVVAAVSSAPPPLVEVVAGARAEVASLLARCAGFAAEHERVVSKTAATITALGERHGSVVLWGGGTKGVMLLNVVPGAQRVRCCVDINPRKQGGFVVGSGHAITSPEALRDAPPGAVLLVNPLYEEEVRGRLAALGLSPVIHALGR
jgi:SAM-dependent methyltransferase